jgi:hypothetical protein
VFDVLRAYDYLRTRTDVGPIGIVGQDRGAVHAYLAAALEQGIEAGAFHNLLLSYRDLVHTRMYRRDLFGLGSMAWGMLRRFDLVDLLPCLAGRAVAFVAPRDATGTLLSEECVATGFLSVAGDHGYLPDGWSPSFVYLG